MKRKIILMGGKTHVVSLPSYWIKNYNVKKGQEVDIYEEHGKIVIDTEFNFSKIKNLNLIYDLNIENQLIRAYQTGYDEIKIIGNINFRALQQIINNKLLGFEIVRDENRYCIVRCISEVDSKELNNMLKRSILLLSSVKTTNDYKKDIILKLIYACKRIVNKRGYKSFNQSLIMYNLLCKLENIKFRKDNQLQSVYETFLKYEANKLSIKDLKDCTDPLSETIVMMALC